MSRKKVLFTSHTANFQKFNRPFMRMLREQGYEVHYASMGEEKILDTDKAFVVPFMRSPFKLSNFTAYKQLKEIIDRENYDLIHTHTPMGSVITRLAARGARRKGTRVIYTAHGFHFFKGAPLVNWLIYYPVEKWMAHHTDTLITINDEDYQCAKKKFNTDVQYVPGVGVDPKRFEPRLTMKRRTELRSSLGLKPEDFVIIYPAELSKRKNQKVLLEIIVEAIAHNSRIHLLLPGKDSMNGAHKRLSKKLGIYSHVHFLGYRNDIAQLLMASELSISTSSQEGLPVHIMEAMAAKLPVVSLPCRGVSELIQQGGTGYIVGPPLQDVVQTILKIADNPGLINALGEKASEHLNTHGLLSDSIRLRMAHIYANNQKASKRPTVAIITPGLLPVPATLGGAVESLCENFIKENEIQKKIEITMFSTFEEKSETESFAYSFSNFFFIKTPRIIKVLDLLMYSVARLALPKKNTAPLRYITQRAYFINRVAAQLSKENFDHLLFENQILLLTSLRSHRNLKKYAGRYSLHTHNQMNKTYGNKKLGAAANNIAVSNYIEKNLRSTLGTGRSVVRLTTVRNGIDQKEFTKRVSKKEQKAMRLRFGINEDDKVLLFVGRLTADKGIDKLIASLAHIKHKNYKLLIVGSSFFGANVKNPFISSLRRMASPYKEQLIFTGYINYTDMPKIYSLADISIIPSIGTDAAPLTIVESLTMGLPIITTDSGGIPEYVNDECAIILKRDEAIVKSIAYSIDTILGNEKLQESMRLASVLAAKKLTRKSYYQDMLRAMELDR